MSPISILALVCGLAACASGAAVEVRLPARSRFSPMPLGINKIRVSGGDVGGQIVGGSAAKRNQFPHQASMQVTMPDFWWWDSAPQHLCGGTIIASNWILTAAHCVYGVPDEATKVEVVVGITDLTKMPSGAQRIKVSKMLAHAKYDRYANHGVGPFDIGLLKLETSVRTSSSVKLAKLPVANALPKGEATLSGWGSTSEDGNNPVYPNELRTAVFPIVDFKTCYEFITNADPTEVNPLADTNLCVGPLDKTGLSSCSGDSGGPLIQESRGKTYVIGVVSWGLSDCGSIPFPSVFTRTSAYIDWIEQTQSQNQ